MLEGALWLLRRQWWAILLPVVAVVLGGLLADRWQPARYPSLTEASTRRSVPGGGVSNPVDSQLQEAKDRLTAQEQRLANYHRLHPEAAPLQPSSTARTLQRAQSQLQSLAGSMARARQRRLEIERAIAGLQTPPTSDAPASSTTAVDAVVPSAAARDLGTALARLDVLKVGYPEGHPDIAPLEQTIRTLQAQVEKETQHLRDLRARLDAVNGELAAGHAEETRLRKTIADAGTTAAASVRDSELAALTREYATLQDSYSNLLRQRGAPVPVDDASANALKVVAPATLPSRPLNERQRQTALLGGALAGLAVGLLLLGFLGFRTLNFQSEEDVRRLLALPVLALIPPVEASSDGPGPRLRVTRGRLTALAIIGSATAAVLWRLRS